MGHQSAFLLACIRAGSPLWSTSSVAPSEPQPPVTGGPVLFLEVNGVLSLFLNHLLYDDTVPGPRKPSP